MDVLTSILLPPTGTTCDARTDATTGGIGAVPRVGRTGGTAGGMKPGVTEADPRAVETGQGTAGGAVVVAETGREGHPLPAAVEVGRTVATLPVGTRAA